MQHDAEELQILLDVPRAKNEFYTKFIETKIITEGT